MLRADLHIHTNYSPDSGATPKSIVDQCLRTGLNCIAITDHNTIDGALEVQRIAPFKVIVGEEVKSSAGDIIGLFLKEAIPRNLTPLETVQAIKAQGALVM
ncbi:MAG: PHP domain-containing protein, partial [Dehalococcoidia bacterium]